MRSMIFLLLLALDLPVSASDDRFLFEDEKIAVAFVGPVPTRVPYDSRAMVKKIAGAFSGAGATLASPPSNDRSLIVYPERSTSRPTVSSRAIERREATAEIVAEVAMEFPAVTNQSLTVRGRRGRVSGSGRRQSIVVSFTINFWRLHDRGRATVKLMTLDLRFSEETSLRVITGAGSIERHEAAPLFYQHAFEAALKELEAKLKPMIEQRLVVIGTVLHSGRADKADPVFVIQLRPEVITLLDGATIELWQPAPNGLIPLQPKLRLKIKNPKLGGEGLKMLCCEAEAVELLAKFKPGDLVVTTAIVGIGRK